MNDLQAQLTSGKRDREGQRRSGRRGAGRARDASIGRTETSQRAVDASKVVMTQTESTLGDAGELMQQARELMVSAGNGGYGDPERKSVANQLQSIRTSCSRSPTRATAPAPICSAARARPRSRSSMPPVACNTSRRPARP